MGAFVEDVLDHYFRAQLVGADKIPDDGPLILTPNHSGNAFPHDAFVLDALLWRHGGYTQKAKFRSVFTPQLAASWWMRPYGLDNWWRRGGGVDMSFDNYDRLLDRNEKVLHYPEGIQGIGKGFNRRYQLQHFHSSFVTLAARHEAPVFPVSIVNAEWVNPTSITFKPLDRLVNKLLSIPFLPVPIALLALLFPFIFYLSFPAKMTFVIHDPVDAREMLRRDGCSDVEDPPREASRRVAETYRQRMQALLDADVDRYGRQPYRWRELVRALGGISGRIFRATPFGWPFTYLQHDRDRRRPPARNWLHALVRDLDILAYYVPFGWPLIALLRRLRRPPYGYRGLTPEERMRREGDYRWSLDVNPLPEYDEVPSP